MVDPVTVTHHTHSARGSGLAREAVQPGACRLAQGDDASSVRRPSVPWGTCADAGQTLGRGGEHGQHSEVRVRCAAGWDRGTRGKGKQSETMEQMFLTSVASWHTIVVHSHPGTDLVCVECNIGHVNSVVKKGAAQTLAGSISVIDGHSRKC